VMKALLVAGASVVLSQSTCAGYSATNCTGNSIVGQYYNATCGLSVGSCVRNVSNAPLCATNAMTCSGNACGVGMLATNLTSCSKCGDQCAGASSTACVAAGMNGACTWYAPACGPVTAMMTYPCSGSTQSTCTGELGCFWVSVTANACGGAMPTARCFQCNSTASYTAALRSALYNNVGKTCSWAAATPFTSGASLTINAVAQSADTVNCPAFAAASALLDPVTITTAITVGGVAGPVPFFGQAAFSSTSVATCATQGSGVAELLPSVALLGLIAFLA